MYFNCPSCEMSLMAEPQMSGKVVKCPGCNAKLEVPAFDASQSAGGTTSSSGAPQREVWKEQDPTNPNGFHCFGIGMGLTALWFIFIYFFKAPEGTDHSQFTTGQTIANLFYKHFTVSFLNTLFFFWAGTIIYLKLLKLRHQRRAMLLDVLPRSLGNTIDASNVGAFIDHVYGLPVSLRDSLMVNRIRKALEFFEVRQNVADVSTLMSSQSGIDGSRIIGSYIMPKAFLWAIPLLGFIGTVVGLSHAISGMSFSNVEDVSKIVGSINNVTSGLGTAFDATLLGLVFAVLLNFPLNSLTKHEEETLNDIDAFCNEVLLPRLDDGAAKKSKSSEAPELGSLGEVAQVIVTALTDSQREFLTDLNALSARMVDQADRLEHRNEEYQQAALSNLSQQLEALDARAAEHFGVLQHQNEAAYKAFGENMAQLEKTAREMQEGFQKAQSSVLTQFSEKLGSVGESVTKSLTSSLQLTEKTVGGFAEHFSKLDGTTKQYQDAVKAAQEAAMKSFSDRVSTLSAAAEKSLAASLESTQKTFATLDTGIRALNTTLEQLGSKQVLIQQVKKKGWFSRD